MFSVVKVKIASALSSCQFQWQQWETQKRQLESKLPIDVQLLMAQKRELTMQLDREQNEKHELFLQINSMIAQLAETQPAGEVEKLKSDNRELKRRVEELESSSAKESSRLEADLQKARHESEVARHQSERERRKIQDDLEETKKELHMKAAALQSLMLATQDNGNAERLKEENEQLTNLLNETEAALSTAKRDLQRKNVEIAELIRSSEDSATSSEQLEMFEKKLSDVEKVLKQEMATKEALKQSCEQLLSDGKQAEEKLNEWRLKHEEDQRTIAELKNDIEQLEKEAKDMVARNRRWEFERDEEVKTLTETLMKFEATLSEKDSKINAIQVQLLEAQSRVEQAEADLKAKDQLVVNTDRRVQQLQAQLDAKGNTDKEVELLREELKKAEDRNDLVLERHQKAEAAALEAAKGQKQLLDELEKKLEAADERRTETESKLSALEDKLKLSNDELNEKKEHIKKLEQELVGLQNEKKKLESRASVADELNTLMSSLSAVRAENGQYQEEIRALHEQVREVKEELERSMEECDEWKGRFETAEREKEVMEKRINSENEKLIALASSEESHKAHEAELESSASKLEEENGKLKEETRGLHAELERVQNAQKAVEEESMRKLRELTEKCESIQKEADTSRSKVGQLEEEHHRFRDAAAEERKKLLELTEEQRFQVEELQEEVNEYKGKLKEAETLTAAETERYQAAKARLAEVEREYEEMKASLRNIQGVSKTAVDKSQEENFAVRIKQQLEELEKDKTARLQEMAAEHRAHQERLEKRIEDMEAARVEQIKELENQKREVEELYQKRLEESEKRLEEAIESHRVEVEKLEATMREKMTSPKKELEELRKANAEMTASHIEQCEKLNKKIADLESRLGQASKNNAEMVENMRNMSVLLETEAKKREELTEERKKWLAEMEEKERLLDEARNTSEDEAKISALAAENVRLASEVLKAHTQAEKTLQVEKELITKQFSEKLKTAHNERDKFASDLEALRAKMKVMESRIEDQRSSIEQAEKMFAIAPLLHSARIAILGIFHD
ncbi:M protein repeat protein [Teladorsagia circumcincta]|uniref:M protein repeat protein n=1 Tax=Teladorsagia circumcincta TaxID=45464 RepID=A0A2G9V4K6_TELCI|nr:M protein repeat protein [Teladorsagia circumcincta]